MWCCNVLTICCCSKGELDRLNGLQEQLAATEEERVNLLKQNEQLEAEMRKLKVRSCHS